MEKRFNFSGKLDFNDIDLTAANKVVQKIVDQLETETNGIILGKVLPYSGSVVSYTKPGLSGISAILGTDDIKVDIQASLGRQGEEEHKYEFYIETPLYSKYKYRICYLQYGASNYPVKVVLEEHVANEVFANSSTGYIVQCQTPQELEELIVKVIYSKVVLNVMQELIRINQIQKAALVEFDSIEGAKDETT